MSTNEIILAVVGAVLVVFSLVVALVVPKRNPDFPSRRMGAFFAVSIALVAGMLATVEVVGAEDEEQPAAEAPPAGEPAPPAGEPAPAASPGDPAAGAEVFAAAACGSCHTLADADASGTVGPNLDNTKPPYELVIDRVTNGRGVMPSFSGQFSEQQIQDVASYVVQATSG
jgi:mono/diheme cytochrome c family protein